MSISPELRAAINLAANQAAEQATQKVLLTLGVNASDPSSVTEHQKDNAFVRRLRKEAETSSGKIRMALIGGMISLGGGIVALVVENLLFGT